MENANETENEILTAADSGTVQQDVEIYIRDGFGNARTLVASGRRRRVSLDRCADHFVAHGVCVDCTQRTGNTVWAE